MTRRFSQNLICFWLRRTTSLVTPLIALVLSAGCAPFQGDQADSSTNSSASVYRLPWLDASGNYTLQDIKLSTFSEPGSLRGNVAEIIVVPRTVGSSVGGEEPIGRWVEVTTGGVRKKVPADLVTMQAATLYAHLEKLNDIDVETGLSKVLTGRMRVGLLARIAMTGAPDSLILNNAVYDGRLDALFVVPYTPESGLAIAMNAGIIGHEHFHRLFQSVVMSQIREAARIGSIPYGWDDSIACASGVAAAQPDSVRESLPEMLPEIPPIEGKPNPFPEVTPMALVAAETMVPLKIYNQASLRGLNEGLADFWGWAYSQDDSFVARTLGANEDEARRLDRTVSALPHKATLRQNLIGVNRSGFPVLKSEGGRVAAAYRFGTEYARVLRSLVQAIESATGADRATAASRVRKAMALGLQGISEEVVRVWGREEIEPERLLRPVVAKLLTLSADGPAVLDTAGSVAVCRELNRLRASSTLTSGLCGDLGAASVVTTPSSAKLLPTDQFGRAKQQ